LDILFIIINKLEQNIDYQIILIVLPWINIRIHDSITWTLVLAEIWYKRVKNAF